nr:hypothetical protein [Candidatus Sigynarchaeota archaeon]
EGGEFEKISSLAPLPSRDFFMISSGKGMLFITECCARMGHGFLPHKFLDPLQRMHRPAGVFGRTIVD